MKIQDYLHYYIGQEIYWHLHDGGTEILTAEVYNTICYDGLYKEMQLLLRPLLDMQVHEARELIEIGYSGYSDILINETHEYGIRFKVEYNNKGRYWDKQENYRDLNALQFHYLLSKGFDIFNLIPEGLAIDKTKS